MTAVATLSLSDRAQMASAAQTAAYELEQRGRADEYRRALIARLKERVADALEVEIEDAQIARVGSSSAVASVEGLLIEWRADEHGYARRGSLALLRRCDRCGKESVPLDFHDLASLGARLDESGPHRHMWDCAEREELEPQPERPRAPTTDERLIAVLRDFVQEHASA